MRRHALRGLPPAPIAMAAAVALLLCACSASRPVDRPTPAPATSPAASVAASASASPSPSDDGRTSTLAPGMVRFTIPGPGGPLAMIGCLPPAGKRARPVLVMIHGGGYVGGSASDLTSLCREASTHGFAAFSLSYRLLPVRYPAQLEDLATQIRWLRSPATSRRFVLDPAPISVLGTSAGAALASELLTGVPGSTIPVADFRAGALVSGAYGLRPGILTGGLERSNLGYLGCSSYAGCPAAAPASAAQHVRAGDPPMLIINSTHELMPLAEARGFAQALAAVGAPHRVLVIPGADHAEGILGASRLADETVWSFLEDPSH